MNKTKKYGVIVDFWEAYKAHAEELRKEDPELDEETADMFAWDDLSDDLKECIIPEIDRHAPHGIAVFADLGLWNGRRRGVKIVDSFRDVLECVDDVMYLKIETTPQGIEVPTVEEFIDLLECFQAGYEPDEISEEEYPCLLLPSIPSMLNHATRIIEEMDLEAMRELIED